MNMLAKSNKSRMSEETIEKYIQMYNLEISILVVPFYVKQGTIQYSGNWHAAAEAICNIISANHPDYLSLEKRLLQYDHGTIKVDLHSLIFNHGYPVELHAFKRYGMHEQRTLHIFNHIGHFYCFIIDDCR